MFEPLFKGNFFILEDDFDPINNGNGSLYVQSTIFVDNIFNYTNNTGVNLENSLFKNSFASISNLFSSNLSVSNLIGSNLSVSNLIGSNLSVSNLISNNLSVSNLISSNLSVASLSVSNLSVASLSVNNLNFSNSTFNNLIAAGSSSNLVVNNITSNNILTSSISIGPKDFSLQPEIETSGLINSNIQNSSQLYNTANVFTQGVNSYFCVASSFHAQYVFFTSLNLSGNTVIQFSNDWGSTYSTIPGFSNTNGSFSSISSNYDGSVALAFINNTPYKIFNFGQSVTAANSLSSLNDICISLYATSNSGYSYAVGSTVYRSVNSGSSWGNLNFNGTWNAVECSPDGSIVIVAGNNNVFFSTDFGNSWNPINGLPASRNWISIAFGNNYIWLLENTNRTLWVSSNGVSGTFVQASGLAAFPNPLNSNPRALSCSYNGRYVITLANSGFQFTTKFGQSWLVLGITGAKFVYYPPDYSLIYLDVSNTFYQIPFWRCNISSSFLSTNAMIIKQVVSSSNSSSGALVIQNGGMSINGSADVTNVSNGGALTIAGGTAIAKNLIVGNTVNSSAINAINHIFRASSSGNLSIQAAASTSSYSLTWPSSQGVANSFLLNNGSGALSFSFPILNSISGVGDSPFYTTASTSLNLLPNTLLTPDAGTYLALFSGSFSSQVSSTTGTELFIYLIQDVFSINGSIRRNRFLRGDEFKCISVNSIINVNGSEDVAIYWANDNGLISYAYQFSFDLVRIGN